MTATAPVSDERATVREERFAGRWCLRLSNGRVSVWAALDVGPRVLGFAFDDGPEAGPLAGVNVFADRLDVVLERPDGRACALVGGHRLWTAPEDPARTYQPDDRPVAVGDADGALRLAAPPDAASGLRRTVTVALDGAVAVVDHHVSNGGTLPVRVAPWAITAFPLGGTAVVALPRGPENGLLPDRRVVLWPYTRLDDPRLTMGDRHLLVWADAEAERPVKVGASGVRALAYVRPGAPTFVKRAAQVPGADYPDLGCGAEVYANGRFCELETLGPLVTLAPGATASHRERWSLHAEATPPADAAAADALFAALDP